MSALKLTLPLLVVCGVMSAADLTGDLSKYREFQLGANLATVAKQAGASPSQAKVIHSRPALIQELDWRPQPLGPSAQSEAANNVVFSFYNGELYRIAIHYDRHETEGMTNGDFVDAISATYGPAERPIAEASPAQAKYSDPDETVARWQDPKYSFELVRSSYGPSFQLIGMLKSLQEPVLAANLEAKRLDDLEAPQRDAARLVSEADAAQVKLEKARLLNKPRFRM
jgi:hypothetical protein